LLYCLGAGLAMARGADIDVWRFLFGYLIFMLAHLSVSFSNDYFDREADALGTPNEISGGSGVLVQHPELARTSIMLAVALLIASGVAAVLFMLNYSYGLGFLAFALVGGWWGYFYSAPPFRFAWRGLGEVATAIAAGVIMPGMGYLSNYGTIDGWFILISLPFMLYGLFFILAVEMPDSGADRAAGKVNFVSKHGVRAGQLLSLAAAVIGTIILAIIAIGGWLGNYVDIPDLVVLSLIPLATAVNTVRKRWSEGSDVLKAAKYHFASLIVFIVLAELVIVFKG
jgi:1,4-dihydroxy-2-naphthoate octaprenyltransferase